MEFTGLIPKFLVNRKLTDLEKAQRLLQTQRLELTPRYQLGVIKLNSTFLEMTDKWFQWKGVITTVSVILLLIFGGGFASTVHMTLNRPSGFDVDYDTKALSIMFGFAFPMLLISLWFLLKESFAYTHYPIRFNRKTGTVHVFRTNGTVLSVPWRDVYFTLGRMPTWDEWDVRGHVLDKDGVTVLETFALSYTGGLNKVDVAPSGKYSDQDFVRAHFEFVRRYMEEGPETVVRLVHFCMPVADKRESFIGGFHRLLANLSGGPLVAVLFMAPFCALFSVFRAVAMRTSKIPRWPAEIERTCAIADGDPYAIEGSSNGDRIPVFPASALAAAAISQAHGLRSENS